jgi:hypothetical protein
MAADQRRNGMECDRRQRLVICRGRKAEELTCRFLGADDRAGPNHTGQTAVDSYYDIVKPLVA